MDIIYLQVLLNLFHSCQTIIICEFVCQKLSYIEINSYLYIQFHLNFEKDEDIMKLLN